MSGGVGIVRHDCKLIQLTTSTFALHYWDLSENASLSCICSGRIVHDHQGSVVVCGYLLFYPELGIDRCRGFLAIVTGIGDEQPVNNISACGVAYPSSAFEKFNLWIMVFGTMKFGFQS